MSHSRETILQSLREANPLPEPIPGASEEYLHMVPLIESSSEGLLDLFVKQAQALDSRVHHVKTELDAIDSVLSILADDRLILGWDFEHIPIEGLKQSLIAWGIKVGNERDPSVRVGITGVDAALAATGSLVLESSAGKPRLASLLPPVHVAIVRSAQIVPDLETWVGEQRKAGIAAFRQLSSLMVISGPSRTADIAMEPILGMHGPEKVHIVLIGGSATN